MYSSWVCAHSTTHEYVIIPYLISRWSLHSSCSCDHSLVGEFVVIPQLITQLMILTPAVYNAVIVNMPGNWQGLCHWIILLQTMIVFSQWTMSVQEPREGLHSGGLYEWIMPQLAEILATPCDNPHSLGATMMWGCVTIDWGAVRRESWPLLWCQVCGG